jgi:hypothetical protein
MTDDDEREQLAASIERLAEFRASWEAGAQIDEASRLSAADLDLIIPAARRALNIVQIQQVDLQDLAQMKRDGDV